MKPIKFKGHTIVFAEDQPDYTPLPAKVLKDGTVISCWRLTAKERSEVFRTGRLWIHQLTFNQPLQPILPSVKQEYGGD